MTSQFGNASSVAHRATVIALRLNRSIIVFARQRWVHVGWYPPIDSVKRHV